MEKRPQRSRGSLRYPTLDELGEGRRWLLAQLVAGVVLGATAAALPSSSSRERPAPPAPDKKKSSKQKRPPAKRPRPPIFDDPGFAALPESGLDELES